MTADPAYDGVLSKLVETTKSLSVSIEQNKLLHEALKSAKDVSLLYFLMANYLHLIRLSTYPITSTYLCRTVAYLKVQTSKW